MRWLRGLVFIGFVGLLVPVAIYTTQQYVVSDHLVALFLRVHLWLPPTLAFEHFVVFLLVLSLLALIAVLAGCGALLGFVQTRHSLLSQKVLRHAAVAQQETDRLKEQQGGQCEQLRLMAQTLAKRMDKRVLIQAILEAASRMTSGAPANSVVSLWALHFETDTLRFEQGLYCDESLFVKTEFQLTEQPFAQVLTTQKTSVIPKWDEKFGLLKTDRASRLGSTTGVMIVPMVIEGSVLGVLVIFCHPNVLKSYEEGQSFFDAVWGQLTLALAIAVQGEVAILDRLTGVHNREYFMKRLIQEIERANRYRLPLSLLMIDIDNFKLVNDMLGHQQGDAVLKIIAKLIKREARAIDLIGRYGGEEFVIMLPETGYGGQGSMSSGAYLVAERIRNAIDEEFHGFQKPLNLTISIGVSVRRYPEDREVDFQELIRQADEQLYQAKATGKNKVCMLIRETPQVTS